MLCLTASIFFKKNLSEYLALIAEKGAIFLEIQPFSQKNIIRMFENSSSSIL